MKALRILVAANVPGARSGGMTRIMGFTHDVLATHGHSVEYFYAEEAAPSGVQGRWGRLTYPRALARHVARAARAGQPYDVVNVHEPAGAWLVRERAVGSPAIVATSHGLERRAWELALEEGRLGRGGPSLKTRLVYPLTGLSQASVTLRGADHVLCLNTEDVAYLSAWLGRKAPPVTRIFPGVDPLYARSAAGRDWRGAFRLLFAGTWRKNKGIQDLVPAFTELAAGDPGLTLTVLGSGASDEEVQAAFAPALRERVRCTRTSSDAEAAAVYAAHDIFVLPSLFEGTPLTLIEAMASGLPVVTTKTCGMKDTIRDGENGLLVPIRSGERLAAAVRRLQTDQELRRRLGTGARRDALTAYTWERAAQPILDAYEAARARVRGTAGA
jgi:glycosyltransferase involved in cell wall biosynthesis